MRAGGAGWCNLTRRSERLRAFRSLRRTRHPPGRPATATRAVRGPVQPWEALLGARSDVVRATSEDLGSAWEEADEPLENGSGLGRYLDFEPGGLGGGDKTEFEEGAARLLASSEIRGDNDRFVAVYEPKTSAPIASFDLDHPTGEELSPLLDPSVGVVSGELTCDGHTCHIDRLVRRARGTRAVGRRIVRVGHSGSSRMAS